ncbi:4-hydroxyphenylacetate 3-hydroxylase N-terminal domain-containing protein [Streptomyces cyaneofuscatus]|uniref:4-hydroxyphenylacetate 3-hydroxylase N-terminal domain-containing protein n=1 Tax=Streptomyces cyaneofuscatus TaxID=66883 RepID=UPI0033AD3721
MPTPDFETAAPTVTPAGDTRPGDTSPGDTRPPPEPGAHDGRPGLGAHDGASFVASLADDREVWVEGERVDVTTHPDFRPMLRTLAGLYDRQRSPELGREMTFRSEVSGHPVSLSYLTPRTPEDLDRKWINSRHWVEGSHGQISRIPDFMANVAVGLHDFRHALGEVDPVFAENAERYYLHCRENDLVLTHGLGDPQVDRSVTPVQRPELGLRVVHRDDSGIVVRGAKQIATLAPYAHDVLIYLSPANYLREDPAYVCWFGARLDTPGLRILCRRSYHGQPHTLGSRFDEQDAMLVFDDAFIPRDRVFLLDDAGTAVKGFHALNRWSLYTGQIRLHHRLRVMLGVASLLAKSIGVDRFREVGALLGELASYVSVVDLALKSITRDATRTKSGLLAPGTTAALDSIAGHFSQRASAIVRQIGASGLIMQPAEGDLHAPDLRTALDLYMGGRDTPVEDKSRMFRLAGDLVIDRFGMRQELYEAWNRGDPARVRSALYTTFTDLPGCEAAARVLADLLEQP